MLNTGNNAAVKNNISLKYEERSYESYYNFSLSQLAYYNNDPDLAIKHMEIAEISDPSSTYIKYQLALLYMKQV